MISKRVVSLILLLICSMQNYASGAENSFPFKLPDITTTFLDSTNSSGYAILNKGRIFYYKKWATSEHSALEATIIDANLSSSVQSDWFSEKYIENRILWLAQFTLNNADYQTVIKTFNEKTYKKEKNKSGEIVYSIPGTNYSEFFFAIKQPGVYIDFVSIKIRYVMQL